MDYKNNLWSCDVLSVLAAARSLRTQMGMNEASNPGRYSRDAMFWFGYYLDVSQTKGLDQYKCQANREMRLKSGGAHFIIAWNRECWEMYEPIPIPCYYE